MFEVQGYLSLALSLLLFAIKIGALVDCVSRDNAKFLQVGTMPRRSWLIILVLAVVTHIIPAEFNPLDLFSLVGTVAALVYLALLRGSA
jgi:hypothetical protein